MRCSKAGAAMMKYIDEPLKLGRFTSKRLFSHLRGCRGCREEFEVYDELIRGFSPEICDCGAPVLPSSFEAGVMSAIKAERAKSRISAGNAVTAVLCALSIIVGIAVVTLLAVMPEGAANIAVQAEKTLAAAQSAADAFFSQYKFILAGVFGAFVFVFSRLATAERRESRGKDRAE